MCPTSESWESFWIFSSQSWSDSFRTFRTADNLKESEQISSSFELWCYNRFWVQRSALLCVGLGLHIGCHNSSTFSSFGGRTNEFSFMSKLPGIRKYVTYKRFLNITLASWKVSHFPLGMEIVPRKEYVLIEVSRKQGFKDSSPHWCYLHLN